MSDLKCVVWLATILLATVGVSQAEVLIIPSDGTTVSSEPLTAGIEYVVEASGTYLWNLPNDYRIADAEWAQRLLGTWNEHETNPSSDHLFELMVNEEDLDWMGTVDGIDFEPHVFSPSHVYRLSVTGTGEPIDFRIEDNFYDDNEGSLQVLIVPEPSTFALLAVACLPVLVFLRRGRRR